MIALTLALVASMAADTVPASGIPLRPQTFESGTQETVQDNWLGEDKFKHFTMSFAITAFAYAGARIVFDRDVSVGIAIATSLSAGLLKEFRDRSIGRPFSARDLVWDAAGTGLAYLVVRQAD